MSEIEFVVNEAEAGSPKLILAHGAGAPMDSPFMDRIASGVGGRGVTVLRFEFPYMRHRREDGRRRGPDRADVLRQTWIDVVEQVGGVERLVIGGKSMGGRIASLVADEVGVAGLVCLGYPFHPPARPERLRTAHLAELRTPTLIVQGSRDRLGTLEEIAGYTLSDAIRIVSLEDGDHSFKPRVCSGLTESEHLDAAVDAVATFVAGIR